MNSEQLFAAKINALILCNPQQCQRDRCPLWYAEKGCCDAKRFLNVFETTMTIKLGAVRQYEPPEEIMGEILENS